MSLFSVHKHYKLDPIFLRTVSMSTLYFHTALWEQHRSSLFALKVERNFVPIWRAWLPYWTLKEQLQSQQKSFTKGKRAFFSLSDFLFRNKFRHYFHAFTPPGLRFSTFLHSPWKFQFATKIDWCMSFSANGILLRPSLCPDEVEMKILQSWRQALLSSPLPQSSHGSCPKSILHET